MSCAWHNEWNFMQSEITDTKKNKRKVLKFFCGWRNDGWKIQIVFIDFWVTMMSWEGSWNILGGFNFTKLKLKRIIDLKFLGVLLLFDGNWFEYSLEMRLFYGIL
jgi:hypothetical protein